MKKTKVAVVGYGNIGRCALDAIEAAEDMELAGIVRRNTANPPAELAGYKVVNDIAALCHPDGAAGDEESTVDVAILCTPSRLAEQTAAKILSQGINTVDSFDIHSEIAPMRERLDAVAKKSGKVAIVAAGWDPGSDSVVRALLEACAPAGTTYTDFGPGMSMGHTVAAKSIAGVKDALSMTLPAGEGRHNRHVYIEVEPGANFETVAAAIKSDPYFAKDTTEVEQVANVAKLTDVTHGVKITREGVSGKTKNQRFEYSMRINNPALTAQILVSAARAATRLETRQNAGAYTMIEIAPIDFLAGEKNDIIKRIV